MALTGNGLTVTEDLARRFIFCELDARCEDPELRPFAAGFLEEIERRRSELLTAAVSGAGSGKGLLVRAICAIAFGIRPRAFTTGGKCHELDKRLAAELIEAQPALLLDNANGVTLRSDTLASVLTERPTRVRVLGETRMVPLNSAAFVALTGNGLTVTEDLARRFIFCELDARCEDPELRPFAAGFLEEIERRRSELLTAALTIWRWGRQNTECLTRGKPLADPVQAIADRRVADPQGASGLRWAMGSASLRKAPSISCAWTGAISAT